jgi:hypothetical protein
MQGLPAPTCAQCGLRLDDVGGERIVATAEGLRVKPERDAEGNLRWFCQKCAGVVCGVCGSLRLPLGTDILMTRARRGTRRSCR